jgi:hypothetical protein
MITTLFAGLADRGGTLLPVPPLASALSTESDEAGA